MTPPNEYGPDKMTVAEIREKHGAFMGQFGRDVKAAWPTVYALLECLPSLADEIERLRALSCEDKDDLP